MKLESSIDKPLYLQQEAWDRLCSLFPKIDENHETREYTLNELFEVVRPKRHRDLALELGRLAEEGLVTPIIRVISPTTQSPLASYSRLFEVPKRIRDHTVDQYFDVTTDNLELSYKPGTIS